MFETRNEMLATLGQEQSVRPPCFTRDEAKKKKTKDAQLDPAKREHARSLGTLVPLVLALLTRRPRHVGVTQRQSVLMELVLLCA